MRVLIFGGTGLLGYHAAMDLVQHGHTISVYSSGTSVPGDWYPPHVSVHTGDIFAMDQLSLEELLRGFDAFVYAVGPDERITPKAPAHAFFYERLVLTAEKVCLAARAVGLKRAIILNSYFSYLHREHPEWCLTNHHPYIRCRVEQSERCLATGSNELAVMVLEIPYVFGLVPNRTPLWKEVLVSRLNLMSVCIFFPPGGTVMATASFVGQAVRGALENGQHGTYPVGEQNMAWREWLHLVSVALYGKKRPIVTLPCRAVQLYGYYEKMRLTLQGKESGLDYGAYIPGVQCRYTYFDEALMTSVANELKIARGTVDRAIYETFIRCR